MAKCFLKSRSGNYRVRDGKGLKAPMRAVDAKLWVEFDNLPEGMSETGDADLLVCMFTPPEDIAPRVEPEPEAPAELDGEDTPADDPADGDQAAEPADDAQTPEPDGEEAPADEVAPKAKKKKGRWVK